MNLLGKESETEIVGEEILFDSVLCVFLNEIKAKQEKRRIDARINL